MARNHSPSPTYSIIVTRQMVNKGLYDWMCDVGVCSRWGSDFIAMRPVISILEPFPGDLSPLENEHEVVYLFRQRREPNIINYETGGWEQMEEYISNVTSWTGADVFRLHERLDAMRRKRYI